MVANIQRVTVGGRRIVLMEEGTYERLLRRVGRSTSPRRREARATLPKPAADGSVPAVEFVRAIIAQGIIRDREALGLTQSELARQAGVRPETISRIESGKHTITKRIGDRIDAALKKARATR